MQGAAGIWWSLHLGPTLQPKPQSTPDSTPKSKPDTAPYGRPYSAPLWYAGSRSVVYEGSGFLVWRVIVSGFVV